MSWSDQPSEVAAASRLCAFSIAVPERVEAEIRHDPRTGAWYLTIGNLFGSQSLRAASAVALLLAVEAVKHRDRGRAIKAPPNTTLLDAPAVSERVALDDSEDD